MGIELLGPVRLDGAPVALQRRDQVVLAALAVRRGGVMSADELADALWPDVPPPTWPKVIHGAVLRLRRALGAALIETTAGGYRLAEAGDGTDIHRFEELIERGRALLAAAESDRAVIAFDRALELWRGSPYEVLDGWPPGRIETARLGELRRTAEEQVVDARLEAGEHREVVAIAEARVAEEPLREHRWAALALAQYRCGRQADALRSLRLARRTLLEQLGIEPGIELVELEAAILRQDEKLVAMPAAAPIADTCPFMGLASYDVDDHELFFGRDADVAACRDHLRANPVLAVTGPSGCGKSSIVRAGLVPALRRAGSPSVVFVPGADPDAAMSNALASADGAPVLVIDQFEEVFTLGSSAARTRGFLSRLAEYATGDAPVVVVVRADHVASLAVVPEFARLVEHGLHLVPPLAGEQLRQAIEGPATLAGLRLEQGLVDLLVRDTEGEPGALPLLSHALVETWHRRDGRTLTVAGYRATGEIRGAVARSADRLYESLPADQRPKLRSIMLRLVSAAAGGEPVRSRIATRNLGGDADRERVLDLLVRARLVTAEEDSVELAHEALARAWPRLRSWLDEDATGQRILRHLSAAADGWESLCRPSTELYRGTRLDAALEWQSTTLPDLTASEQAFLTASVDDAATERHAVGQRARTEARQNRRLRRALVGVAVLLVASLVGGIVAVQQRRSAQRDERASALTALTANSAAQRHNRRDLAALLAVEAHRMAPSAATASALFGTFTAAPGMQRTLPTGLELRSISQPATFIPGADVVALTDRFGAVLLIDATNGASSELDRISDEPGSTGLAVAKNGRYLAVSHTAGDRGLTLVTVWDVETRGRRFRPVRVPAGAYTMAISDDGRYVVASGGTPAVTQIRDGVTGELVIELEPTPVPGDAESGADTAAVAFAPDGRLAVGSLAGEIRFVDPSSGEVLERFDGPPMREQRAIYFSDDGATMVVAGPSWFVGFDVASAEPLAPSAHTGVWCNSHVYADRLGALLCGEWSGRVLAYDIDTGLPVGRRFDSQQGDVCSLAISPDGNTLVEVTSCFAGEAVVVVWRLDGGGAMSRAVVSSDRVPSIGRYGFRGDATALIAEYTASDGSGLETHVIDPATGTERDAFPDVFGLVPTDQPDIVVAYFAAQRTIGSYDVSTREPAGPAVAADFGIDGVWVDGHQVIVSGDSTPDDDGDTEFLLQGVDLATGRLVAPSVTDRFDVAGATFSADALYVSGLQHDAGATRWEVQRRDRDTGDVLATAVDFRVVAAAGSIVVAGTSNGAIREVDPLTLEPIGPPFPGTNGAASALALDAAGTRLMVVADDATVRVYDVASRLQLGDAIDRDLPMLSGTAALRADGLQMAVETGHGIVSWDLDPAHWVTAACDVAGRNLTQAEWDQYIGDLAPYRRTCSQFPAG